MERWLRRWFKIISLLFLVLSLSLFLPSRTSASFANLLGGNGLNKEALDVNGNNIPADRGDVVCYITQYLSHASKPVELIKKGAAYDASEDKQFNRLDVVKVIVEYLKNPRGGSGRCVALPQPNQPDQQGEGITPESSSTEGRSELAKNIKLKVAYKFNCSNKRNFDVERMQIEIKKIVKVKHYSSNSYDWLGRKYYGTLSKESPCQPLHIFTLHPSPQGGLLSSNIPTQEILNTSRDPNAKIVVDLGLLVDKYVQCPNNIPFKLSKVPHQIKVGDQEVWVSKARDPKRGTWLNKIVCYTRKWQDKTVEITDPAKVDYLSKRKVITFNIDNSLQPTINYIIEPLPTPTPTLAPLPERKKINKTIKLKVAYRFNCSRGKTSDIEGIQIDIDGSKRIGNRWVIQKDYGSWSKFYPITQHLPELAEGELLSKSIPEENFFDSDKKIIVRFGLLFSGNRRHWELKTVEIRDPEKVDYLSRKKIIMFRVNNSLQPRVSYIVEAPTPTKIQTGFHFKVVANNLDPKRRVIAQVIPQILPGNIGLALCSKQYAYWRTGSWPGILEGDLVCNIPSKGFHYYRNGIPPYEHGFKAEILVETYSYYYKPKFVGRAEWIKKHVYITSPEQRPTISLTITNPSEYPPTPAPGQWHGRSKAPLR